jgi:hypothetical protein
VCEVKQDQRLSAVSHGQRNRDGPSLPCNRIVNSRTLRFLHHQHPTSNNKERSESNRKCDRKRWVLLCFSLETAPVVLMTRSKWSRSKKKGRMKGDAVGGHDPTFESSVISRQLLLSAKTSKNCSTFEPSFWRPDRSGKCVCVVGRGSGVLDKMATGSDGTFGGRCVCSCVRNQGRERGKAKQKHVASKACESQHLVRGRSSETYHSQWDVFGGKSERFALKQSFGVETHR